MPAIIGIVYQAVRFKYLQLNVLFNYFSILEVWATQLSKSFIYQPFLRKVKHLFFFGLHEHKLKGKYSNNGSISFLKDEEVVSLLY